MEQEQKPFEAWAIVELMGHRRLAGKVTEQQIAGAQFLRLDIPMSPEGEMITQFYGPSSVYCITPTTREIATGVALRNRPQPVSPWELQQAGLLERPQPTVAMADPDEEDMHPDGDPGSDDEPM